MKIFEEGGRQPGHKSTPKFKRLTQKPSTGVQLSIKNYLCYTEGNNYEESKGKGISKYFKSIKPMRPGIMTMPRSASTSSPDQGGRIIPPRKDRVGCICIV